MSSKKLPKDIQILKRIVILMREEGIEMDSPYDFENWMEDHSSHSDLFETGEFPEE